MYSLFFTEEFKKNFEAIKDKETQRRILKKVLSLKENPSQGRMLVGVEDEEFGRLFRLRVGKYRVIYALCRERNEIYLITLGHRERVYRQLGR